MADSQIPQQKCVAAALKLQCVSVRVCVCVCVCVYMQMVGWECGAKCTRMHNDGV